MLYRWKFHCVNENMNLCDLIFVVKWKLHSVKKVMHEYGRIHSSEEHGTCYFNKPCGTFFGKSTVFRLGENYLKVHRNNNKHYGIVVDSSCHVNDLFSLSSFSLFPSSLSLFPSSLFLSDLIETPDLKTLGWFVSKTKKTRIKNGWTIKNLMKNRFQQF